MISNKVHSSLLQGRTTAMQNYTARAGSFVRLRVNVTTSVQIPRLPYIVTYAGFDTSADVLYVSSSERSLSELQHRPGGNVGKASQSLEQRP